MNIHFDNPELFQTLLRATLVKVPVGSACYGLQRPDSDDDFFCIFAPPRNFLADPFVQSCHHMLQFKHHQPPQRDVDYNFVDLFLYLKNLARGDSPLGFESLYGFADTPLDWLYQHRHRFLTFNIIRCYLGYARKDLKLMRRESNEIARNTKVLHSYRSLYFAAQLLAISRDPDSAPAFSMRMDRWVSPLGNTPAELRTMTRQEREKHRTWLLSDEPGAIARTRQTLRERLEKNTLPHFLAPSDQALIAELVAEFLKGSLCQSHTLDFLNPSVFYEANEQGVEY